MTPIYFYRFCTVFVFDSPKSGGSTLLTQQVETYTSRTTVYYAYELMVVRNWQMLPFMWIKMNINIIRIWPGAQIWPKNVVDRGTHQKPQLTQHFCNTKVIIMNDSDLRLQILHCFFVFDSLKKWGSQEVETHLPLVLPQLRLRNTAGEKLTDAKFLSWCERVEKRTSESRVMSVADLIRLSQRRLPTSALRGEWSQACLVERTVVTPHRSAP